MNVKTATVGACCCLVALVASVSSAQTEWTAETGPWSDPDNWTDGVPDHSRDADISNGGTAQIVADATAWNLYVGSTADSNLCVWGARVLWKRQPSPAPADKLSARPSAFNCDNRLPCPSCPTRLPR